MTPHEDRGRRMLIPHGDIVDFLTPIYPNNIVQRGWQILTPHEDQVLLHVITPVNVLFRVGGEILCDDDHDG